VLALFLRPLRQALTESYVKQGLASFTVLLMIGGVIGASLIYASLRLGRPPTTIIKALYLILTACLSLLYAVGLVLLALSKWLSWKFSTLLAMTCWSFLMVAGITLPHRWSTVLLSSLTAPLVALIPLSWLVVLVSLASLLDVMMFKLRVLERLSSWAEEQGVKGIAYVSSGVQVGFGDLALTGGVVLRSLSEGFLAFTLVSVALALGLFLGLSKLAEERALPGILLTTAPCTAAMAVAIYLA